MPLALVVGLFAALYLALAPAVVNGDGLGYLRAAVHGGVYPGHLGYLPLLRVIPATRPVEALAAARALSVAAGAGALALFGACARRLQLRGWLVATVGLGSSFGVLASASDVESYAPALFFLCVALYAALRKWALGAALAATLAALMHVENALFVLPLAFLLTRRRALALLPLPLLALAYVYRGVTPLGASHGFHYPLHAWTPFIAVYGATKALLFSPYLYEASWPRVLACFLGGAVCALALLALAHRGGLPLGRPATLAWLVPYAAVGMAFFASDPERWTFLLPLLWLSVAAAGRVRATAVLVGALLAGNLWLWLPRARDDTWRKKAEAATTHLQPGDLVISPGHGWDEYVGFWSGPRVLAFPLVYFAGELGSPSALNDRLARERAAAPRVVLVRMEDDGDPLGWKELLWFGITPATLDLGGERVPLGDGVSYLRPSLGDTRSRN